MLLLNRLLVKISLIFALLSVLSGCIATVPDQAYSSLKGVQVSTAEGRVEQLFRYEMNRLIKPNQSNQYDLSVTISSSRRNNRMDMTINYTVYDQSKGEIVVKKSVSSSASIGAVTSDFGKEQAYIHAEERLSINLAQKIYQRLLVYFSQPQSAS